MKYNKHASDTLSMNDWDSNMAALDSRLELASEIVGKTQFSVAYCSTEIAKQALEVARAITTLRETCAKHRYETRMRIGQESDAD